MYSSIKYKMLYAYIFIVNVVAPVSLCEGKLGDVEAVVLQEDDNGGQHPTRHNDAYLKYRCTVVHVCFLQVTTCGAPDVLTRLGAHTFLLLSHLLGSQNKYQ